MQESVGGARISTGGRSKLYRLILARISTGGRSKLYRLILADSNDCYYSVRTLLAIAAAEDLKLRHLNFERAFLETDVDEKIYAELPEGYQALPGAVGKLNNAVYGLVQAGRY